MNVVKQLVLLVRAYKLFSVQSMQEAVWLLSTHADRQRVDISVAVCFFCNFVCVFVWLRISLLRIKIARIKFCMVVHRGPGQAISHFGELCPRRSSPRSQNQMNRPDRALNYK